MADPKLYSVKMRAAARRRHISGAESIVSEGDLRAECADLLDRAARHTRGAADEIHLKIESVDPAEILRLEALPVTIVETATAAEGRAAALDILRKLGAADGEGILSRLDEAFVLRGALLLNVDTLERLDPDRNRGVRVTRLDGRPAPAKSVKNHFYEALILATKAAHAPGIIGEICISDDPDYVTGYVASRQLGYIRITTLKQRGDERGGRILLYRGAPDDVASCVDFLQNRPVLVRGLPAPQRLGKWAALRQTLAEQKAAGLCREIIAAESAPGPRIKQPDSKRLSLGSNNYLDLAADPRVTAYAAEMTLRYGAGAGGARLMTGSTPLHSRLEAMLADWKGTERALLFGSGYMANVGVIAALCARDWVIFSDELNHASIIDGCRLSRARVIVYKHNDLADLAEKARIYHGRSGLIVSDAVFSMDGDIVDLPGLLEIAERYGLYSMLDEAHAAGVIGRTGRGITEYFDTSRKPDILMGTCSKALGSAGGFVCGGTTLIEFLLNHARSFIFSTALPAGAVAAALKALEILQNEPERVRRLQENIRLFTGRLRDAGAAADSSTAIVPVILGAEQRALAAAERLKDAGVYMPAIRYPAVPAGRARLRASLTAGHTPVELIAAADAIGRAVNCREH